MSKYPEKCHVAGCPCHEWSAKSPSESPETPEGDAGFLVPEAKNVSESEYGSGNGIPVTRTAFGFHLDTCGVCASVAEQFPDLELFDHQLCPEGRQLFRNPSQPVVTPRTFTEEWNSAPRWATRTTEIESAQYWFLRGGQAKEIELTGVINEDLKEIRRVAGERLQR